MEHTFAQASNPLNMNTIASLRELQGDDDPEFLKDLIETFFEETNEQLVNLEQAVAQQNAVGLQRIAHALKSSSANVGAVLVSKLCKDMEEMGRNGQVEGAAQKLEAIKHEYHRAQTALQEACEN
jgi:HPt (histidine-containing phosphotransfer) domain-containing protein